MVSLRFMFNARLNWLPGQLRLSVPCGKYCTQENQFRLYAEIGL